MISDEAPISEVDRVAILATAADYIESWVQGDADRMARCLHPSLRKRAPWPDPSSHDEPLNEDTWTSMVDATRSGYGTTLDPGYTSELLDAYGDIASVAVYSSAYMDYLHIARFGNEWRIVNALWQRRAA